MEVIKGSDLKLLLKRRGITSTYLSEMLSIHKSQISRYFTDDITMPASFLLKVAKLAGLDMSDLIKEDSISTNIVSEPMAVYGRTVKNEPKAVTPDIEVSIKGMSLSAYIQMIEQRLADMERSVMDLQKKSNKVMEMEMV